MAKSTPQTLRCSECSYENEPERVYCHNCGNKLDRSLLPKDIEQKREKTDKTRRRIKRMTNPGGSPVTREIRTFVQVVIWSAVVALLVGIARPPADAPPAKATEIAQRIVSSDLQTAIEAAQPVRLEFTEADVNSYLRSTVKPSKKGSIGIDFKRAYSKLRPGVVHIGSEQSLWGYSVYSGIDHKLEIKNGVFKATNVGGNFGRVRVHPALMPYADWFFRKLWTALRRESLHMNRMQYIDVGQGRVTLVTKPAA